MAELYFTDTVVCELGKDSNCAMKERVRVGPQCAKCGFNKRVHKARVARIREGLDTFSNGNRGLKL